MRIAALQCPSLPTDVAGNLRRLERTASNAAQAGAALLVCPEMFLTGYNIGAAAVAQLAEAPDGASARAIAEIARRADIAIVYGYPERAADGAIFNAASCIAANGVRIGHYRKTHLFGELDRSMFAASSDDSPLMDLDGWRIGMLICYDLEFPENARRLALAGADLIVVPTANMLDYDIVATTLVPARAFENQCYVAYANHCGSEGNIVYGGLSSVVAPDGSMLARAGREEAVILADIEHASLAASRARFPYLGDRRPELYAALADSQPPLTPTLSP